MAERAVKYLNERIASAAQQGMSDLVTQYTQYLEYVQGLIKGIQTPDRQQPSSSKVTIEMEAAPRTCTTDGAQLNYRTCPSAAIRLPLQAPPALRRAI